VALLGTGQMGSAIARILLTKPSLALVGVLVHRPERAGVDAAEVLGLERAVGVVAMADLDGLLDESRPDLVIQATCSTLVDAEPALLACLERGIDVVSIAEELAWPWAGAPDWAEKIDALARARGATVLGTGVNPGFVLDLLVIALTGVCAHVETIRATRVNDLSPYGPTVLRTQGVGLTPEAFAAGVAEGSVVGHVGFPESVGMIAGALGWTVERVEQHRKPIIATVRRETPFVTVEPGMVAGCFHTAVGWVDGRPAIHLIHPQQVRPEAEGLPTGDTIEITGTPDLRITTDPEIPGGLATAALAVNMIPRVRAAAPGLTSMAQLPVPAAVAGEALRWRHG
jgi:2,4-diaminopentanoate dehydrogenase